MKNINELIEKGYTLENVDNLVILIKNSYNDIICSVFFRSGLVLLRDGQIFNYKSEIVEGIKKYGTDKFLNNTNI